MPKLPRIFWAMWCLGVVAWVAIFAFVAWVVVKLLQHFGVI